MMPPLTVIFGSYQVKKFDEGTWFINFMEGSQNLYLLEGEDSALLIDSGYGTNTLAEFVKTITQKPLIVANTHFHPDHAGGNGEFPSVMLHHNWAADANAVKPGPNLPFDIAALPYANYEKVLLRDGDVIDLGGRKIEVLELCAHSNSSLAFLDREHRFLICGDELEAGQVLLYDLSASGAPYDLKQRLLAHRMNMKRLKALQPEIDCLLPNHNGFPIDKTYIDDFIALTDAIFSGDAVIEDKLNHRFIEMDPIAPRLCRVKLGRVSFFMEKELLLQFYGKGEPPMSYFTHEKVTDRIIRIRDVSGVCIYLIEGDERSALIDTGVGFGDLYGYVMELTEKEPVVIVTHGHVDHAMGAGAFREVYINPDDEAIYHAHSFVQARKGYTMGSGISGGHPEAIQGAPESEWKQTKLWEEFKQLSVGDVFDLGGIHLQVCPGGGHTLGCVTILIPEEKMLFLGDAVNDFTFLFDLTGGNNCLPLTQYQRNLKALEQMTNGRYDRCMFFHGPGEGPVNMVESVIRLIDEIMAGKDDALPFAGMGRDDLKLAKAIDFSRMCRADGGVGNLVYDPALK